MCARFASGLRGLLGLPLFVGVLMQSAPVLAQGSDDRETGGVQNDCRSVVLVRCARLSEDVATPDALRRSIEAAQRKLQLRRLHQRQSEVGLNTIEVTAERPAVAQPDPWENFRQSVANAAAPDCFAPSPQGDLLTLPFLLDRAAAGKCR